ncbi:MAG TPA: hypothetical protein VEB86_10195 [Chryseosolibacter sp.]|nr:hypothetical protein [Chryseosolibacter sp.]
MVRRLFFAGLVCLNTAAFSQQIPSGYKLVYEESFDKRDSYDGFTFTQPDKWLLSGGQTGKALEFTGISDYQPPFRSPHTIALIATVAVGSFILEADLLQTGREYGHRDMCVVFGFQDPSHFYYAHIASKMDDNAHQLMVVNEAPRKKISLFTTPGVEWGQGQWHKVRVERTLTDGKIRIFFDGQLIQEAVDASFANGYIGFGSFDDSGKVDNIRLWAPESRRDVCQHFQKK